MSETIPLTAGRNGCGLSPAAVDERVALNVLCRRKFPGGIAAMIDERIETGRGEVIQFGRRPIPPRACIIENKTHVRLFLAEMLDELGFIAREAFAGDTTNVLREFSPDLVVVGPLGGDAEMRTVLQVLYRQGYSGK